MKDGDTDDNNSKRMIKQANIANDDDPGDTVKIKLRLIAPAVMEIAGETAIASVIKVVTMMMNIAVTAAEARIITLMTPGSEAAIRIKNSH